jgi:hypothetical protein
MSEVTNTQEAKAQEPTTDDEVFGPRKRDLEGFAAAAMVGILASGSQRLKADAVAVSAVAHAKALAAALDAEERGDTPQVAEPPKRR